MVAYERFEAWQAAHLLALEVFKLSESFPRSELYVVTAQVRRAALSVPSNIAEGAAKQGRREFARYLNIASGSLAELKYLLRFCHDRGLYSTATWNNVESLRDRTGRLVYGLYRRTRIPA